MIKNLRFWLFSSLILLAPLSKYPSWALPKFNFTSFRIGLYQMLAFVFVITCLMPLLKNYKKMIKQNPVAIVSIGALGFIALIGLFWTLDTKRSALLASSIMLLLGLVLSSWWYVSYELGKGYKKILSYVPHAALAFGLLGIIQLILSTLTTESFGVLCTNCTSSVFGFPRINEFAAEPQFLANSLLQFFFILLVMTYKNKSRLNTIALFVLTITIGLTFSRGAYISIASALIFMVVVFYVNKIEIKSLLRQIALSLLAIILSFLMLIASSSYRYSESPNIAYNTTVSMLEQLSLGVINLPTKTEAIVIQQEKPIDNTDDNFTPAGLVESSTNDRLGAAELALKAWGYSIKTLLIGVGPGNLGPFVVNNISPSAPNNLTVYIYYILILAELGSLGLLAFLALFMSVLFKLYKNRSVGSLVIATILIAFLAQYTFFGSYINVVYIWLWVGIGLGWSSYKRKNIPKTV